MNTAKIKTLDAALSKIEELENQLATAPKPVPATPPPTITTPVPAAQPPKPAPRIEDLSRRALVEIIDLAQKEGNQELIKLAYGELQRRRN
jgi:hypothetical protein